MPTVVGSIVAQLRAETTTLRRDFAEAQNITREGAHGMSQILEQYGEPAFKTAERGAREFRHETVNLGHELRGSAHAVRALALPFVSELAPALGSTISTMTETVIMSVRVSQGLGGVAIAAASVAGILAGKLLASYQDAAKAQEEFTKAMTGGDVGQVSNQIKKISDAVLELNKQLTELAARANEPLIVSILRGGRPGVLAGKAEQTKTEKQGQLGQALDMENLLKGIRDEAALYKLGDEQLAGIQKQADLDSIAAAKKAQEEQAAARDAANKSSADAAIQLWTEIDAAGKEIYDAEIARQKALEDARTSQYASGAEGAIQMWEDIDAAGKRMYDDEIARQQALTDARTQQNEASAAGAVQLWAEIDATGKAMYEKEIAYQAEIARQQQELVTDLAGVATNAFDRVTDSIVDAFVKGDTAALQFENVVKGVLASIASDLIKLAVRAAVVRGITAAVGALGWGSTAPTGAEQQLQEGGIVTRPVHALVGESGPEAVIPLSELHGGGGGDLTVNIINQAGVQVEAEQQRGADGRKMLQILIRNEMNSALADGSTDKTMGAVFGITRKGRLR